MKKNEIYGYEPLVDDLKELIHKKQYQVIKLINSETINLYWEIGEEIYRQLSNIDGCSIENDLMKAYKKALDMKKKIILICGSFYLLSKFKEEINE